MMKIWPGLLGLVLAASTVPGLRADEAKPLSSRESLRASAYHFCYSGSMLFHTAFHQGVTTRFLLLKAALHSEELAKHFKLNEQQRLYITTLQPVKVDVKTLDKAPDPNAQ